MYMWGVKDTHILRRHVLFRGCRRQPLYCFHNAIPSYGFGSRIYIYIYIMLTLRWYNNTNIYILAVQAKYYV